MFLASGEVEDLNRERASDRRRPRSRCTPGEAAPVRVLVVCTGNSARSILGEALLRHLGGDRIEACSAGTHPGAVNPLCLRVLEEAGIPTDGLRRSP